MTERLKVMTVVGRNGYGLTFALPDPAASMGGSGAGGITVTHSSDGALSLQGTAQLGDTGAARNFQITANGNVIFSGRINNSGATFNHVFTKAGGGELLLSQGSASPWS